MEITESLRQSDLFEHFSDEQLEQLARCTSLVRYPEGALIIKEGDNTHDAYFIQSGEVRIQRNTPYGLYRLADLSPYDMFGETSFIDQCARSGDALVRSDAAILPFNSIALQTMTDRDQRFTLALYWTFWRSLSTKLRLTTDNLAHFFSESGSPTSQEPMLEVAPDDFKIEMSAKQDLFREQKLSSMEIHFFSTLSKEIRYEANEKIFHEGDEGDHLYVVLKGRVMISKNVAGAGEEALAFLDRGAYFGEMALIDKQPRSADAKAADEGAVVLAIPNKVLEGILDKKKVGSVRLLTILCRLVAKRLREIDDKIVSWFIFSGGSANSSLQPPP